MNILPRTIAGKLVFYLGLTNCLVVAATVWSSYVRARQMLVEQIDSAALKEVRTAAIRLDDFLAKAATRAEMIASRQLSVPSSGDRFGPDLMLLLLRMLKDAPADEAYGLWFCRDIAKNHTLSSKDLVFATHRHTYPNRTVFSAEYVADIPNQEWYSEARQSGRPYISEPYYDEGGGETSMVSLSRSCFDEQGQCLGVAGVDVDLAHIFRLVSEIQTDSTRGKDGGYAFLVSGSGRIITHPDKNLMLGKNNPGPKISDLMEGRTVADRATGAAAVRLAGADRRLYWATAPSANWKIVLNVSNAVVSEPVRDLAIRAGLLGLAGVVLSSLMLIAISRGISRPIIRLTAIAQRVAEGNLRGAKIELDHFAPANDSRLGSVAPREADETARLHSAISTMTENLSNLIGHVQHSGARIMSTANQIAATAKQQETMVHTFGGATTEVSASAREISATSQDLMNTMGSVSEVAAQTACVAESGRVLLRTRHKAMDQLLAGTAAISAKLSIIRERAGEINKVIATITSVADLTNVLSLNATIEAEKAGEVGRGFSVVAREVRRLADQAAAATVNIEQMVKAMQSSVSSGVMEMDKFSRVVSRDVEEMGQLTSQLDQIIQQVKELTARFEEVNAGMRAQSQGAAQISEATAHLNEAAGQTAVSVSEFNQATRDLGAAVAGLQDQVSRFNLAERFF
ncbi:MAG: methyl-accepting chemotaxis protein [Acidobacteriota bacterium]